MRKPAKYLNLKRARIRQSWNKHNLYNLVMMTGGVDVNSKRTFFQQKWAAKSMTRGYHGEHIAEKKWKRMFSRRLSSAVDMPPEYLAKYDGSEQGAGRGSGLTTNDVKASNFSKEFGGRPTKLMNAHFKMNQGGHTAQTKLLTQGMGEKVTPVMQMVYAPLERRLDTAIFRSLFATSIRQARQFVIHGAVTVNGKKMSYPAYRLNPGDMFQVDAVKVLAATAAQKKGDTNAKAKEMVANNKIKYGNWEKRYELLNERIKKRGGIVAFNQPLPLELEGANAEDAIDQKATAKAAEKAAKKDAEGDQSPETHRKLIKFEKTSETMTPEELSEEMKSVKLETALLDAKYILTQGKDLSEEDRLMKIASFKDRLIYAVGPWIQTLEPAKLLEALTTELRARNMLRRDATTGTGKKTPSNTHDVVRKALEIDGHSWGKSQKIRGITGPYHGISKPQMHELQKILEANEQNAVSAKKPYATPWQPRAWMKPWCFVPRYLEVNHKICAAVYLRHPVARKGQAEVPTPFHYFSNQLAHAWYVTKGVSKYKHKPQ